MSFDYPKQLRFRCLKECAVCCGDTQERVRSILLMKTETDRIAEKTRMNINDFADRVDGLRPYVYRMRKNADGKCLFLKDSSCTIYQIRPLICRFYPFEFKKAQNGNYTFSCTSECAGIGEGPILTRSYFEKLLRELEESNT